MKILLNLLLSTAAVILASFILPGISVDGYLTAFIVAVLIGLVNSLLKPVLFLITLPITILTLGLFSLVLNGVLILLVSYFVPGFHVTGLLSAILFSILLSLINGILHLFLK